MNLFSVVSFPLPLPTLTSGNNRGGGAAADATLGLYRKLFGFLSCCPIKTLCFLLFFFPASLEPTLGLMHPCCEGKVCRCECRDRGTKRRVCDLWKWRIKPSHADDSAGFDTCGGLKRSPTIERNKDALFGSVKPGVKKPQNHAVWRKMRAASAWTRRRAAAATQCAPQ